MASLIERMLSALLKFRIFSMLILSTPTWYSLYLLLLTFQFLLNFLVVNYFSKIYCYWLLFSHFSHFIEQFFFNLVFSFLSIFISIFPIPFLTLVRRSSMTCDSCDEIDHSFNWMLVENSIEISQTSVGIMFHLWFCVLEKSFSLWSTDFS